MTATVAIGLACGRSLDHVSRAIESAAVAAAQLGRRTRLILSIPPWNSGDGPALLAMSRQAGFRHVTAVPALGQGVAEARNSILTALNDEDYLYLFDDDETVGADTILNLLNAMAAAAAPFATGPINYSFERPPTDRRLDNFQLYRLNPVQGPTVTASCGNLLVDLRQWREIGSPLMSSTYDRTGSEDTAWTRQLAVRQPGIKVASAWTEETVPAFRVQRSAMARRLINRGAALRILNDLSRPRAAAEGAARILSGTARLATFAVTRRPNGWAATFFRGVGLVTSALGVSTKSYWSAKEATAPITITLPAATSIELRNVAAVADAVPDL